ncbi:MAG: substrate-binding domain-containing protein [Geminicoccaceae bacterium]|nr:substrate-binding domain-containing protein [Geminicoccaceae bacterium]
MFRRGFLALAGLAAVGFGIASAPAVRAADDTFILVQSTTSTQNSGLFDYLLPKFKAKSGIEVRVVAVGTGQAIKNAKNGDGDVLFVHSKPDEVKFVEEGYGVERFDVMYNDFVIVGPKDDPAGIKGMNDAAAALAKIAEAKAPFASRGDDSGTDKQEKRLWATTGADPKAASGGWYRETGSGMGPTLNTAAGMGAYALTDRGTWISFKNKGDLEILVEGDPRLFNQYGVILVNPKKFPHVKAKAGQAFVDWLISPEGQQAIAGYEIDGQQLFFPDAKGSG